MSTIRESFVRLLFCTLLVHPLVSQAENDQAAASQTWYQFEVLIFERIAPGAGSTEGWSSNPGRPQPKHATWLSKGSPMRDNKPIAFRALPAEERALNNAWGAMRRSRDYRPLYHAAWRQPMKDPKHAQQIHFSLLPADGGQASDLNLPKLEGSLKFGIQRYLHLDVDIALHKAVSGNATQSSSDDFNFGPSFKHYRLQDSRRMRSGKLHYIDHPVIGLLTIAKRYEMPQPEIIEPTPLPITPPVNESVQTPSQEKVEEKPAIN
ncbi:MAG: peptidoglycan binding protein CsiV [Candidatus Thiodiazotropha sp.]|nr:peptidoglycan binding protein CsiV [Candidatus Thiodiazotropha sp.]MCM8883287.1 peptidoglycan binding protein CsiV [Candidatus Thiodiazotropha sp.]MCM8919719.1 peptidoglycan binding protein CsiV [Candidatus Thiodiazotropha sp.]